MSLMTTPRSLTVLVQHLQARLSSSPLNHPFLRTIIALIFSYRTLLLILALLNLKSIPFSWHVRLFSGMGRYGSTIEQTRQRLRKEASLISPLPSPKPIHPIFRPVSVRTRSPLYECDYNLHKSNSTYFSDLDVSRGKLVARMINPTLRLNALVPHGIRKGLCYPILGSVHVSFLREIKPYEQYDVRSRILGWDRKWLVIGSWFVRRATREEVKKDKASGKDFLKGPVGEEEVVFACVLNKYVIKAGRVTVPPELALAGSGWFPVRPEATASIRAYAAGRSASVSSGLNGVSTGTGTPMLGPETIVDDAASAVNNVAIEAGRRLSLSGHKRPSIVENDDDMPGWSWDEIEEERLRGLKVAEQWLNLDVQLRKEYEIDMDKGISHF